MRNIRNFVFLFSALFLLFINISYLRDRLFIREFYFISLNIFLSSFIVLDVIYNFQISNRIENLERENERQKLMLSDYKLESQFLITLTDIVETFGEDLTFDEIIDKILEAIKTYLKKKRL